jgi:hypothetical protein
MKYIAVLLMICALVWGFGVVQNVNAKWDFNYCIKQKADEVLTDTETQKLNDDCETSSGYTQPEELLP